ncbi:segregation/condensation protein A [Oscillatoriales cyanobacterium LEGE 11467]|uniref:Segregation and condensation protein A n=1 Tax=Zarconia navalis LEGE 11467 TaxID=1828826 RepID=A0A928VYI9_9CYAN|nr:ScpA family protein [Zarconia navalis]MBE9042471.1 segregation/condensation protein A [Zarconia navalis LEGE 11467]
MTLSLAQDAISVLIDLAERGEIDPWNVKVIEVVDRYLAELNPVPEVGTSPYYADLSRSGQAFLYASMLVLLKADSLLQSTSENDEPGLEDAEEWFEEARDAIATLPLKLEEQLHRRAVAPPPRKRRVTLQEMIDQLQVMATTLAEPLRRSRSRRALRQAKSKAARDITQLAHQENLTEMATELEQFLRDRRSEFCSEREWLPFEELLAMWTPTVPPSLHKSETSDRVALFWALLLLSSQSKVELEQEEFYQDINIRLTLEDDRTSAQAG